jgi:hypothetical protein
MNPIDARQRSKRRRPLANRSLDFPGPARTSRIWHQHAAEPVETAAQRRLGQEAEDLGVKPGLATDASEAAPGHPSANPVGGLQ